MEAPPGISTDAADAVRSVLDGIRREHGVAILVAIESGSRAWGFPSLDSDYDCRFIFVRSSDQYLTLFPRRDVIELPIEGDLDVNGWDIAKALKLILKGNAVALEWLTSPLVYSVEADVRDVLLDFGRRHAEPSAIRSHYLHLGRQQYGAHLAGRESVALKKVFYVLRPAAALRWLRLHPEQHVPPMDLPTLVATSDSPAEVVSLVEEMIARKAVSREMGEARLPPALATFMETEFTIAAETARRRGTPLRREAKDEADEIYRQIIALYTRRRSESPSVG